jgi:hypothetical protein
MWFGIRAAGMAAILWIAASVTAAYAGPPTEWDGLVLRKAKGIDLLYERPDVEYKVYRSVVLDPVEVAFDKNWNPNRDVRMPSARLSADDLQQMKTDMANEFRRIFAEQLAAGGYDVVAKPLDDTLEITAGLVDVYVNAPDKMTAGRSRT